MGESPCAATGQVAGEFWKLRAEKERPKQAAGRGKLKMEYRESFSRYSIRPIYGQVSRISIPRRQCTGSKQKFFEQNETTTSYENIDAETNVARRGPKMAVHFLSAMNTEEQL